MAAAVTVLSLFLSFVVLSPAQASPPPADSVRADSSRALPRVVRRFPPIGVWATMHDMGSSETVHLVSGTALHALPVDDFSDVLALQPGVVATAEELHVRGGRTGETTTFLDGIGLNEPQRMKAMGLPLLALRSADLVSGSPEAQFGAGLAGALNLRSVDPAARPTFAWRWQSALESRWYDRVALRAGTPLRLLGLGLVAAGDATLDDTWLPDLRSQSRTHVAGLGFDWRADNRILGWVKLAPVEQPQRFSLQALTSRHLSRPYDPAWSTIVKVDPYSTPDQPDYRPGYVVYRAPDHLAITDERQFALLASASRLRANGRAALSLGWLRSRSVTSLNGARDRYRTLTQPEYVPSDSFHVINGDYPLYRESGSDMLTLRGDAEATSRRGNALKAGAGLTYEDVRLFEWDHTLERLPVDQVREYRAYAPGAFGYVQGRWQGGGLLLNPGVRAEYFTPGPQATHQTLTGPDHGTWTLSPRLGIAYPISVRDAFSLAYARIHQAPARDFLYDHREAITNRVALGNPSLQPATVISYEAAVKHTFSAAWAMQGSVFYRDIYGQVGVRNVSQPGLPDEMRFVSDDDGHASGFEWSVIRAGGDRQRLELHYTFMEAWGVESRPEGDPYGAVLLNRLTPYSGRPLSWDRRHSLAFAIAFPWHDDWTFAWSSNLGSPLPWTPKERRKDVTDFGYVNSQRLGWTENTNVDVRWIPPFGHGFSFKLEARNLFDNRGERAVTVDGYPNPIINTAYDDYGAYRTETHQTGGAYWVPTGADTGYWVPVHDPRLFNPPRAVRLSVGADW